MTRAAEGKVNEAIRIRSMRVRDLPEIMAIETACFAAPWSEQTFRSLLKRRGASLVVAAPAAARDGESRVDGYAVLWVARGEAELGNLAVRAAVRRCGVGRTLLAAAVREAVRLGVRSMFLEVRESNRAARELYERVGFQVVRLRPNYYDSPMEHAIVMQRCLEGC